jgi:hypothetical protein
MTTNSILMVRPAGFGFNEQTALDNSFQNRIEGKSGEDVRQSAMAEFDHMKTKLSQFGVNVLVLEECESSELTPDAVFPNNWLVTDSSNQLSLFPMKTENRKREVRVADVCKLLEDAGYIVGEIVNIAEKFESDQIVEGTGALVFDHEYKKAYAALSERCQFSLAKSVCDWLGYELVSFETSASDRQPVYHTNVVLSVGLDFIIACIDCMANPTSFKKSVSASGKKLIPITQEQMEKGMCGNVIEVKNTSGERILICSDTAWNHFSTEQKRWFESRMRIANCTIDTIENVGGGSCRCMVAEIYNQSAGNH